MESKAITTQTQKIWVGKDGIVRNKVFLNAEVTLAEAKNAIQAIIQITKGKQSPLFIDSREIKLMTHKARLYLTGKETANVLSAMGVLIDSPISRIIGNFFINFGKPVAPTKLFVSEDEAIAWLKEFRNDQATSYF